ncbi:hypothetical protein PIB30_080835 [Stylosanthes scabra]|uniref:Uncharacterized protein n=1 Tax=Stylosanthes scabra TaxID=79078 RepID=A0ABU6VU67_9FABA|nr:hypothetical protein [Stylosanthes scabra]
MLALPVFIVAFGSFDSVAPILVPATRKKEEGHVCIFLLALSFPFSTRAACITALSVIAATTASDFSCFLLRLDLPICSSSSPSFSCSMFRSISWNFFFLQKINNSSSSSISF